MQLTKLVRARNLACAFTEIILSIKLISNAQVQTLSEPFKRQLLLDVFALAIAISMVLALARPASAAPIDYSGQWKCYSGPVASFPCENNNYSWWWNDPADVASGAAIVNGIPSFSIGIGSAPGVNDYAPWTYNQALVPTFSMTNYGGDRFFNIYENFTTSPLLVSIPFFDNGGNPNYAPTVTPPAPFVRTVMVDNGNHTCSSDGCPSYHETFNGSLTISMNIELRGATPDPMLVNIWEAGIEDSWGSTTYGARYQIIDGANSYPIYFDVHFTNANGDYVVTVVDKLGTPDSNTWYTNLVDWGYGFQGSAAAHEFGHLIGLFDEYLGGTLKSGFAPRCLAEDFPNPVNFFCDGLMGTPKRPVVSRYYDDIVMGFGDFTSRNVVLGSLPTPPYYIPQTGGGSTFPETAIVYVPEPSTIMLFGAGIFGAIRRRHNRIKRLGRT
jgi:hypothetical protein